MYNRLLIDIYVKIVSFIYIIENSIGLVISLKIQFLLKFLFSVIEYITFLI